MSLKPSRLAAILLPSLLLSTGAPFAADPALDTYAQLLSRYVTPRGVRYAAWRAAPEDVKAISMVVGQLSGTDPKSLPAAGKCALYVNLYNAKILETVLKGNPKTSIKEITPGITGFGVFRKAVLEFDGKKISLTDLETRLREESKDPRVHFAVNCASRSCPPISSEPYRGETLDAQLDRSARSFLASPGALVLNRESGAGKPEVKIECSKIFDWYSADFSAAGGGVAFIEKHGPSDVAAAIKASAGSAKLVFEEYDWSLNAAP